jgi:cytochrome c oxidase cbb3-type subunit I
VRRHVPALAPRRIWSVNTPSPTASTATASPALDEHDAPASPADIDVSCQVPVLFLAVSGAIWLVLGLLFTVIASIKLHGPGFLADTPWLTIGRIRPAASNAILYGFASQAAIAVALWLFCRLGGNRLVLPRLITAGAAIWNFGLTLGIFAILAGGSTGFEWLEIPRFAWPFLFIGYALMGVSALVTFHGRVRRELYPAHWFLLTALFWFPWIYSAANLLLLHWPVRGVVQAIVNTWFVHGFLWMWLGFIALAAIFYFIPKLLSRPLMTWALAVFAFWILLLFTSFGATAQLAGGPVPAWVVSIGIGANIIVAAGIVAIAIIWHSTAAGAYGIAWQNPVLRFILAAAGSFFVASALGIILGLREVSWLTRLTYAEVAQRQLAIHGFVGMALFGGLYYILPRVLQNPWPSPRLVNTQFWLFGGGAVLVFVALGIGGLVHGAKLNDPSVHIVSAIKATIPFVGMATLGYTLMLAGAAVFLYHVARLLAISMAGCCAGFIREVRS